MTSIFIRKIFIHPLIRSSNPPSSAPHLPPRLRTYTTTPQPPPPSTTPPPTLKGWRKYAWQFRNKPASYVASFAILHELTAVLPIPLVYLFLDRTGVRIPIPEDAIAEGNRIVSKMRVRYGYEPLDPQNRVMVNLATSYAVVKVLMPARIALSVALTPLFAERLVGPVTKLFRRMVGRPASS
ncbi:hypothetical protein BC936DRAFT_140012 [Jimgerdemannia flammicorona]|uniref:Uncharacterized protein n=2 Tax=Jimgerdemannia flammicorona TaxID=994334 RepID=A0A433B5Y6_9FUNG|nr:hypothetical protein BC936DRAFT_140012 [Jimgerdemannia flammicorona]